MCEETGHMYLYVQFVVNKKFIKCIINNDPSSTTYLGQYWSEILTILTTILTNS